MASVVKKPSSKYWFACFRDRNGKQCRRSTFEDRKSKAKEIAAKYELAAKRKTSRRQLWDTLNELQASITGEETYSTSVQEFSKLWLENRKAEKVAPATYAVYHKNVKRFLEFLGAKRVNENMIDIARRDIERFRNELGETGLAPATLNKTLKII